MHPEDRHIVFSTNSVQYLNKLIPKAYQNGCEPTGTELKFTLRNKLGSWQTHHETVIDIGVLKELSRIWLIVVPTLPGVPGLDIELNLVPTTMLEAIEVIIGNLGHIERYDLVGPPPEDDEPVGLNEDTRARLENQLRLPTSTSRIMEYLDKEREGTNNGVRLPLERLNATIEFLIHLIKWTNSNKPNGTYTGKTFEMDIEAHKLEPLLGWFQETRKKQLDAKRPSMEKCRSLRPKKRAG
ncbi:hypothetical protein DL98DRAFT_595278 [Cadophora sp. DSE1049]|nr:hypothetical protein DL98DRAFT_595278 [Cadophora sp. DSE1049]